MKILTWLEKIRTDSFKPHTYYFVAHNASVEDKFCTIGMAEWDMDDIHADNFVKGNYFVKQSEAFKFLIKKRKEMSSLINKFDEYTQKALIKTLQEKGIQKEDEYKKKGIIILERK